MTAEQLMEKIEAFTEAKVRAMIVRLHLVAINEVRLRTVQEREIETRAELAKALDEALKEKSHAC